MRQRKPRDREMDTDELREWMARVDAEKAEREEQRQRAKLKAVLAEWMD